MGWFWGLVFASPGIALTGYLLLRGFPLLGMGEARSLLSFMLLPVPVTFGVVVAGRVLAAQYSGPPALSPVKLSAMIGLCWWMLLTGAGFVLLRLLKGFWLRPRPIALLGYLVVWLLLSTYAHLQGAVVRWRIRKLESADDGSMDERDSA